MGKIYVAGAGLISVLVVALVVAVLWALGTAAEDRDKFSSLEIAPHDSVFYMAINTKPDSSQWIGFSNTLEIINAKQPLNDAINDALGEFGLIFEDDIIPLAGDEAYLVITDVDSLEASEGVIMGVQVTDLDRTREVFLEIIEEEFDWTVREYQGVEVWLSDANPLDELDDQSSTAVAFHEGVMLVATSLEDIQGGIDVLRGDAPNAATNARITELSARQNDDFLAWGFADLAVFWDEIHDQAGDFDESGGIDTERLLDEARETADRVSFSISTRGEGVLMDVNLFHSDGYVAGDYPGLTGEFETHFAGSVPANTLFYAAGYDLYNQTYLPIKDLLEEAAVDENGETFDDIISDFENEVGFNFERDFISLLTREYAFAVNASDFDAESPDLDVLALFDVDNPDIIEGTVSSLGDYLEQQELISVNETDREDVYEWTEHGGVGEGVTWTVTGDTLAFGYPEDSVLGLIDGADGSLSDTEDWQETAGLLPDRTTSFAFISLARILDEIEQVEGVREEFEESTEGKVTFDDLDPIRSIGMASVNIDGGWQFRVVVLISE